MSYRSIKKTDTPQFRILSGQKTSPNKFIYKKCTSICDSQLTLRDSKNINLKSYNQNTPTKNTKLFFSDQQETQEKQPLQQLQTPCRKPPRPQTHHKTEFEEVEFNQQDLQNEQKYIHLQQKSEQKGEIKNTKINKFNISLQDPQFQISNNNSNYTVTSIRKQLSTKMLLKNQNSNNPEDQNYEFKKRNCNSFQQQSKLKETNSQNSFGNIQQIEPNNQQTQYQNDDIIQNNQNNKQSKNSEQQDSYDTSTLTTLQKSKSSRKFNLIKKVSQANFQNQLHLENILEVTNGQEISQNIISNQINHNQQDIFNYSSENSEQKFIKQLNQIYLHNTKYLFLNCKNENCNYFCILTSFHRQDYYCQQCEMLSVIGDVSTKKVINKCNHTLNYKEIIYIVQDAIQFKKLARCSSCQWEISYTYIKRIDLTKLYIQLKLQLEIKNLKNSILKNTQFQIAECTGPECDFFTLWNPNQPKLKQGFCIFCDKRIAFKMDHPSQNILYQINCGHEITTQKLLGLSSDAQILKEFAKCPQCQVIISLKVNNTLNMQSKNNQIY
ncbi:unnamed protein product [Paramecium primaurelia]|uniref:Uncharacterized protein n=1 Tax=Paramecium primaurelia TaxID=5886 RepID=A0A8S1K4R1_PARPR|nr:unnamed protein product [Paramecium primaurelia]